MTPLGTSVVSQLDMRETYWTRRIDLSSTPSNPTTQIASLLSYDAKQANNGLRMSDSHWKCMQ